MKAINFYALLKYITETLEGLLVNGLKVFLKSQVGGWFFHKILDAAVETLDEKIIDPLIDSLVIRMANKYDVSRAKKVSAKLEQAKKDLDEAAYYSALDDLAGGL